MSCSSSLSKGASSRSTPKLIAFDLDGTIWSPDMYQLWGGGSPFTVVGDGTAKLKDCTGQTIRLLGISGSLLHDLKHDEKWKDTKTAWVSCTDEPSWADECLRKFKSSGAEPIGNLIDSVQIFKDNKQTHFKRLKSQFPDIEFSDMLFFDNEMGNIRSVSKLGVISVYCPDGMTQSVWEEGLGLTTELC